MEQPQRKPNRIENYDYSQNGAYFVTICTQDRKPILSQIVGDGFPVPTDIGEVVQKMIRKIPEKYPQMTVDKFVIMPDHIHLLLRFDTVGEAFRLPENGTGNPSPTGGTLVGGTGDPSPTLGNVIGWLKYQITKEVNSLTDTPGTKLFQRSYYDHVVRNQQDYNEIWEYIDNNPLKWVMTKQGRE